jgi:hypothetical protein
MGRGVYPLGSYGYPVKSSSFSSREAHLSGFPCTIEFAEPAIGDGGQARLRMGLRRLSTASSPRWYQIPLSGCRLTPRIGAPSSARQNRCLANVKVQIAGPPEALVRDPSVDERVRHSDGARAAGPGISLLAPIPVLLRPD